MRASRLLTCTLALAVVSDLLPAQNGQRWEWSVAPTLFAPSQTGWIALSSIGFPGAMTNAGGGFALDVQARRGAWSYLLDGYYVGLNQPYYTVNNNPGGATPDSGGLTGKQWSVQALALKRIVHWLAIGLGVQANGVHATGTVYAKTGNGPPPVPFTFSASEDEVWALPTVAARWTPVDGERWHAFFFAAAGWLGNDNRSYQLVPSVGYRIGSTVEVAARYRTIYTKYITGDIQSQFSYDVRLSGPELAVGMQF